MCAQWEIADVLQQEYKLAVKCRAAPVPGTYLSSKGVCDQFAAALADMEYVLFATCGRRCWVTKDTSTSTSTSTSTATQVHTSVTPMPAGGACKCQWLYSVSGSEWQSAGAA